MHRTGVAAQRPLHEVVVHLVCKRGKVVGIAHLKADDGDQVGELRERTALYLFRLFDGIAVPKTLHGDVLRLQLFIQRLEPRDRHRTVLVPLVIENPQGEDLVFVLLNKGAERCQHPVGVCLLVGVVPGKQHRVEVHGVDDLLMAAAHVFDVYPHVRVIKRLHGFFDERLLHRVHALLLLGGRRVVVGKIDTGLFGDYVEVKRVEQMLRQAAGAAADGFGERRALLRGHLAVQPDHTVCQRRQCVFVLCAHGDVQHEFLHADGGLALQRARFGFL